MRVVVIENDNVCPDRLKRYIRKYNKKDVSYIYNAANTSMTDFIEAFKNNDVILFDPTIVGYVQYNNLMMLLRKLLVSGELAVKEIRLHANDIDGYVKELKELWKGKRDYLDEVLEKVKLLGVNEYEERVIIL